MKVGRPRAHDLFDEIRSLKKKKECVCVCVCVCVAVSPGLALGCLGTESLLEGEVGES